MNNMMKSRHILQPCGEKQSKSRRVDHDNDDRLSKLPNEILSSMMYSFTMKEAAVLGLVSHQWEFIWRRFPILIFENPQVIKHLAAVYIGTPTRRGSIRRVIKKMATARTRLARWVDRVLEQHSGEVIDELRITFDFDQNWQCHVDKWAAIAINKHVKRLELDFSSRLRNTALHCNGVTELICDKPLDLPPKFSSIHSTIRSLCLKYVNATDEFVDCLPRSCPFLESLSIVGSECLTYVSGLLEQLKHLEVSSCYKLKTIDIAAPQLRSFVHYNHQIELLHIAHASSLSEVSIGELGNSYNIAYVFDSFSEYFSQLVYLTLKMTIRGRGFIGGLMPPVNLGMYNPPPLPNLQHLELRVNGRCVEDDLRGWTSLIAASPNMHKLTLKVHANFEKGDLPVSRWGGFPLRCLKTLELAGYVGQRIDLELALFVFENAPMLEEVSVHFVTESGRASYGSHAQQQERLALLQAALPQGVKLIIK